MTVHVLLVDGSSGGTVFNVRAVEESNGVLVCRMEFSDTPRVLPKGAYVNVEATTAEEEE
jgi:hypothetical protein